MGCDIHCYAEKKVNKDWVGVDISLFDWRSYSLFGFLANVRNYSDVPHISEQRDIPDDISVDTKSGLEYWSDDAHSHSWLSAKELLDFNYDVIIEDRRCTINNDGGNICPPGDGEKMTFREFLGKAFFDELENIKKHQVERIVFWFDN